MDFSFTEEQEAVGDLAAQILAGQVTTDRLKEVEASDDRFDRPLWAELAKANLLGIALPEDVGGSGLGLIELCLLLEQQGRTVAPVPLLPTLVAALAVAEFGTPRQRSDLLPGVVAGDVILSAALEAPSGTTHLSVPAAHLADRVLVPAGGGLRLVDPTASGVVRHVAESTNRQRVAHLVVDEGVGEPLGDGEGKDAVRWLTERWLVGLCATQVGIAEEAVVRAAEYTTNREQFGKPLSTFQGVALKAADAYIDTEAMRATMWQAAWFLSEGREASKAVAVAKWWAAEAGQRVVHITQHLHGGLGADIDYPIHRYFLWGKQIETTLGGASAQLARLGRMMAEDAA